MYPCDAPSAISTAAVSIPSRPVGPSASRGWWWCGCESDVPTGRHCSFLPGRKRKTSAELVSAASQVRNCSVSSQGPIVSVRVGIGRRTWTAILNASERSSSQLFINDITVTDRSDTGRAAYIWQTEAVSSRVAHPLTCDGAHTSPRADAYTRFTSQGTHGARAYS